MNGARLMHDDITEQYVNGRLTERDREAFEAHYFECARCFEKLRAYQLAREELEVIGTSDGQPASPAAPKRTRRWTRLAATAVVLLGVPMWKRCSESIKRHMAWTIRFGGPDK